MPYCLGFLVFMSALMLKLDVDLLKKKAKKRRIVLMACATGLLAYLLPVLLTKAYGFQYGWTPVWQKHLLILALCAAYGVGFFLQHSKELGFSRKLSRRWAAALLKFVTGSVSLYLAYSVFCIAVLTLTWPYYKGTNPRDFLFTITFFMPGIVGVLILGALAGLAYWLISIKIGRERNLSQP